LGFRNQLIFPMHELFLTGREDCPSPQRSLIFDRTVSQTTGNGQQTTKALAGEDRRKEAGRTEIKKVEDDVDKKALMVMYHEGLSLIYC
jgi:hypothetical protein